MLCSYYDTSDIELDTSVRPLYSTDDFILPPLVVYFPKWRNWRVSLVIHTLVFSNFPQNLFQINDLLLEMWRPGFVSFKKWVSHLFTELTNSLFSCPSLLIPNNRFAFLTASVHGVDIFMIFSVITPRFHTSVRVFGLGCILLYRKIQLTLGISLDLEKLIFVCCFIVWSQNFMRSSCSS